MAWMIGVDVGGTFTDFFAFDDTDDRIVLHKVPSTPANPAQAVIAGLRELTQRSVDLGAITRLSHGTTVATTALIQRRGGKVALGINQSSGGLMSVARARHVPIRTALSGPAAGAVGAIHMARLSGVPDVISLDMGGTSADVGLIRSYTAGTTFNKWIESYPARIASLDIN